MLKYYIILALVLVSINLSAQIGIQTSDPKAVLHINPKNDNTVEDDVVVTSKGYLGIGTNSPITKLDINPKDNATSSLNDLLYIGNGAINQYLISDSNGNAYWGSVFASWYAFLSAQYQPYTPGVSREENASGEYTLWKYENAVISDAALGAVTLGANNSGTITVPFTGVYKITCTAHFLIRRTLGYTDVYKIGLVIKRNGTELWRPSSLGYSSTWGIAPTFSTIVDLSANDVLEMFSDQVFDTTKYDAIPGGTKPVAPVASYCGSPIFLVEFLYE